MQRTVTKSEIGRIGDMAGPTWVKTSRSRASCESETPVDQVRFPRLSRGREKFLAFAGTAPAPELGSGDPGRQEREMSHHILPSRNRPTPPTMETIVSKFPPRPLCDSTVRIAIGSAGGCACRSAGQPALLDSRPGSTRQAGDVADRHVERELERPARARRLRQQEATLQRGDHRGRKLGRVRLGLELAAVAHRA